MCMSIVRVCSLVFPKKDTTTKVFRFHWIFKKLKTTWFLWWKFELGTTYLEESTSKQFIPYTIVLTNGRQRWVRTYTYIHTFYWINAHLRFFSDQYIMGLPAIINKYYKENLFVERKLLSVGIYYNAPKIVSKQEGTLLGLERTLLTPKHEVKLINVNDNRALKCQGFYEFWKNRLQSKPCFES